ncbi:MAG TPA: NAD(P)H-binding protein [Pseudonocardiaceae bacterium]
MDTMILVTGATGNLGRQIVSQLLAAGHPVRALTRDPGTAGLPDGVDVVGGDLTEPDTLAGALSGVESVFLLWPAWTTDAVPAVLDAIATHARRIVYLSAAVVRDDRDPAANGFWGEIERLIERTGLAWTFLRAGGFATNTLGWADQIRADGVVHWSYGAAARSLIHERDLAAVAVRALTEDKHAGAKYVLTGPAAVTQADQVRIIGEVVGRATRWAELPRAVARQQLLAMWDDPGFVDGALDHWASLVTKPEQVTNTVEAVTGTPARTFREWAADHIEDFRPSDAAGDVEGFAGDVAVGGGAEKQDGVGDVVR